ncbi:hypothetical protein PUN28_017354 [Cardiocondyla obscurior]|uniref:Uncharacterized protein n=1 Tax=Cardiocondyla obscurior TaxID=286306 RepID=A0AAW2EP65_9HYME
MENFGVRTRASSPGILQGIPHGKSDDTSRTPSRQCHPRDPPLLPYTRFPSPPNGLPARSNGPAAKRMHRRLSTANSRVSYSVMPNNFGAGPATRNEVTLMEYNWSKSR